MIGLLFTIIFLPFTLLRMAFGLLGISTAILLIPLKIFARHTILCIFILGVLILYLAIKKDPHATDQLKPAPAHLRQAKNTPQGVPPVIQQVRKREDGNSAFATDTYTIMSEIERAAYSKAFYSVMDTIPDGQAYSWSYYNIQGSIRPIKTFKNKSGATCRSFTEILKVHDIQQTISGTGCANLSGTWCKLKVNATPACGLGGSGGGMFDGISRAVKGLF